MVCMPGREPAQTLWDLVELELGPLEPDDPRLVETAAARGDFSRAPLLRRLGVDPATRQLKKAPHRCYAVLSGHRGCGKSTELRRIARQLDSPLAYCVVFLDVLSTLDPHNLRYPDVFLALAEELVSVLTKREVEIDGEHLESLESWFSKRIDTHTDTKDFAAEVKAGAKVEAGLPFLGKLFAACTNAFKINSTYKSELRKVVQNSFSEFSAAFNSLIRGAEDALARGGYSGRVLFVVDGLDRLNTEDALRLYVTDVYQLQQVDGVFLYVAPIHMLYSSNAVNQAFSTFKLPMIKLNEKGSEVSIPAAYEALRQLVFKRADPSLFMDADVVDRLIASSGGHPRDLLRLLNYAYENATGDKIGSKAASQAIKRMASDYRRLIEEEDYALLREIDESPPAHAPNNARVQDLLHNLVILEYNDYWWRSHPVVRELPGYVEATKGSTG